MLFNNYWGSTGCWWTCANLNLIFIKVQWLQIVLKTTQAFNVLIFFNKCFAWCPVWNFALSNDYRFYRTIFSGLKNIISRLAFTFLINTTDCYYYADILIKLVATWHLYLMCVIFLRLTIKLPTTTKLLYWRRHIKSSFISRYIILIRCCPSMLINNRLLTSSRY